MESTISSLHFLKRVHPQTSHQSFSQALFISCYHSCQHLQAQPAETGFCTAKNQTPPPARRPRGYLLSGQHSEAHPLLSLLMLCTAQLTQLIASHTYSPDYMAATACSKTSVTSPLAKHSWHGSQPSLPQAHAHSMGPNHPCGSSSYPQHSPMSLTGMKANQS